MTVPLLLVGSGGFGRETAEVVRAINDVQPEWDLLGFLDDRADLHGLQVAGVPVLGPAEAVHEHPDAAVVLCTGNPRDYTSRSRLVERLELGGERYATLVHPAASVASAAHVHAGCVLLAGAVVTAAAEIGAHTAVMPGAVITHDDVIGAFVTFAAGARLGGGVTVGEGAYLGAGSSVREGCRVGAWSLVGMGAVVLTDVPDREVWAGVPARRIRAVLDVPGHADPSGDTRAGVAPAAG